MKIIYKYVLDVGKTRIRFPNLSKVLKVGLQNGDICIWVLNNKDEPTRVERIFEVVGTGWDIEDVNLEYLDTVIDETHSQVWHVFEVR